MRLQGLVADVGVIESLEAEQDFLAQLEPKAKRGELTTKTQIKLAFEQRVGRKVHKSTIYRELQRHEFCQVWLLHHLSV